MRRLLGPGVAREADWTVGWIPNYGSSAASWRSDCEAPPISGSPWEGNAFSKSRSARACNVASA